MRTTTVTLTLLTVAEAFQNIPLFAFGPLHFLSENQEKEWLSDHSIAMEDSYPAEDSAVHPKYNFRFSPSTLEAQQPLLPQIQREESTMSEYERQWSQYAPPRNVEP